MPHAGACVFRDARRVVVKVGTSTLTDGGRLNPEGMGAIVAQIAALAGRGVDVVLVTSGAIGAGTARLGLPERPRTLSGLQAAAAVGQGLLMRQYEELFDAHRLVVAQILLTREDLRDRQRYLNSRNTLLRLFEYGAVPIVNENDTVAVDEIRFGDNDTLSALVASLIDADVLLILSDVDGVYTGDPRVDPDAVRLDVISEITPELWRAARGPGSQHAKGGMVTKLEAARIATASGVAMIIAHGRRDNVIVDALAGEPVGTVFLPRIRLAGRKRWIAFHQPAQGVVRVDAGARDAVVSGGKSLLPIGVIGVEGRFQPGDMVQVVDEAGREIARGLANYSSGEIARIQGLRSDEIEDCLGMKSHDEVIHRDNLVVTV